MCVCWNVRTHETKGMLGTFLCTFLCLCLCLPLFHSIIIITTTLLHFPCTFPTRHKFLSYFYSTIQTLITNTSSQLSFLSFCVSFLKHVLFLHWHWCKYVSCLFLFFFICIHLKFSSFSYFTLTHFISHLDFI